MAVALVELVGGVEIDDPIVALRITSYNVCYTKLLRTALLVGVGETIALAARHLYSGGLRRMIVANRSLDRARELAEEFSASAISLDALEVHLAEADIVVSSTASPTPVITLQATRQALRRITSYNVCYTKLLRMFSAMPIEPTSTIPRRSSGTNASRMPSF